MPEIPTDPRGFASMFTVRELVDRAWAGRRVHRDGIHAFCPGHRTILLDSGGYQFLKNGAFPLSLDELADLYVHARPTFGVALDRPIPSGTDRATAIDIIGWNVANYRAMLRRIDSARLIPVVHGDKIGLVERQCRRFRSACAHPPIVGLGGNVPMFMALTRNAGRIPRYSHAQDVMRLLSEKVAIVRATFPGSAVHVFGAGGFLSIAFSLLAGANSVDTAGWRVRAAFGCIIGRSGRHVRLARLRARGVSLATSMREDLMDCSCPSCAKRVSVRGRAHQLVTHFSKRAIHNFWVIAAEVDDLLQRMTVSAASRGSCVVADAAGASCQIWNRVLAAGRGPIEYWRHE